MDSTETVGLLLWWMEHDDYGFCHRFERVAAGGPALEHEPSMLERAKSRWPKLRDR